MNMERAVCDMETIEVFTGNKSLLQKIVNNRDCVIQSWLSAYVVRDFIYFYANVQLMKRDISLPPSSTVTSRPTFITRKRDSSFQHKGVSDYILCITRLQRDL